MFLQGHLSFEFSMLRVWTIYDLNLNYLQTLNNASSTETLKTISSPSKLPSNKHIIPADSICVNKQLGAGEFGIVQQGVWTNGNERVSFIVACAFAFISIFNFHMYHFTWFGLFI